MRSARTVATRGHLPVRPCAAAAGRQPPPPPPPPHAAVALDLEFAHYRVSGGRVARVPAEVAVVGEGGAELLFSRVRVDHPPSSFAGGVPPADTAVAPPLEDVRAAVAALLSGGAAVVGHGVAGDVAALGLPPLGRHRVRDTAHVNAVARKGSTPSLAALAGELGARRGRGGGGAGGAKNEEKPPRRGPSARHCARADARAAMRVYLATIRGTPHDGPDPVGDEAARVVAEWEKRREESSEERI